MKTGFVTNLDTCVVRSAPTLYRAVTDAEKLTQRKKKKEIPKYSYPDEVLMAAMVNRYSRYGVDFRVGPEDVCFVRGLDDQKGTGKSIFGAGYLLSEKAAAEKAAAEKAAAEKAAATRWKLSDREWEIIKGLGRK